MSNIDCYLKEIGILDTPIYERIIELLEYAKVIFNEIDPFVFVSEFVNDEGNTYYESLWLIDDRAVIEFRNFRVEMSFDYYVYKGKIKNVAFDIESYDLISATDNSRMSVRLTTSDGLACMFKSSKKNCEYLLDIVKNRFIPIT